MIKSAAKKNAGPPSEAARRLSVKVRAAEEHAETTKRLARLTKRKLKAARRAHKLARKVAKRARKEANRLRQSLRVATKKSAPGKSRKAKKTSPPRPVTPPPRKSVKRKLKRRTVRPTPKRLRTSLPAVTTKAVPAPEPPFNPPGEAAASADAAGAGPVV